MEIKGVIIQLGPTQQIKDNFKKRQVVVETDEKWAQKIPIDFVQDKTGLLDDFEQGDEVEIGINIRGNEWKGKFYVNLQGWRIKKTGSQPQAAIPENDGSGDDLPF